MKYGFKDLTTNYTGGGINIYMGELDNGIYFMCDDEFFNSLDTDPREAGEEAYYYEWQIEHDAGYEVDFPEFFIQMYEWAKVNKPMEVDNIMEAAVNEFKQANRRVEYETGYIPEMDMTIIFRHEYDGKGDIFKENVSGWYHGEPNYEYTDMYKESNDCIYE